MSFGMSTSEYEDRAITKKSKQSRCVKRFFLIRGIERRKDIKTAVIEVFTTWVFTPVKCYAFFCKNSPSSYSLLTNRCKRPREGADKKYDFRFSPQVPCSELFLRAEQGWEGS